MTAAPESRRRPGRFGPGAVVAAAFIGPGTVTTATLAGAGYGFTLLWALTFSLVATLILHEMAARLGLVTGAGLGEAVRRRFERTGPRIVAVGLVIAAIGFGNAAYETGNLLGAALGAEAVWGGGPRLWAGVAGFVAFLLLRTGSYRAVEGVLIALVALMSVAFLATAVLVRPPLLPLLRGLVLRPHRRHQLLKRVVRPPGPDGQDVALDHQVDRFALAHLQARLQSEHVPGGDGLRPVLLLQEGLGDLARWVLSYGGEAEVFSPPVLRQYVAREVQKMIAHYADET